jgi:hydrogenase nickel incorporation protein HypA/HybF
MHELAVTESMLEIAIRHGEVAGAKRVTDLYLVIGKLSSVVDDSVQFYWDIVSKGTICEGARLHFQRLPATLRCLECRATYDIDGDFTPCPACGSARIEVIAGQEFRLDSVGIET